MGLFSRKKPTTAPSRKVGLYVHIPFCVKKCRYCDFRSFDDRTQSTKEVYVSSLEREIKQRSKLIGSTFTVDTVFIGGGTPTSLELRDLLFVISTVNKYFSIDTDAEFTVEVNPGTADREKLEALKAAGVNRLSIGVQSFDDGVLRALGRIHDADTAREIVRTAVELGFNTNLDLMLGVPGQSFESWQNSLSEALSLGVNHVSFYSLQLEEGTPLYDDYKNGDVDIPSWEDNRRMYRYAVDTLKAAGFNHYEISNAARPGFECRHNIKYWTMQEYLGVGLAAHSFLVGRRFANTENLMAYTKAPGNAFVGKTESESDLMGDYIFTRLRMLEGFTKDEFGERFGGDFDEIFGENYKELLAEGYLEEAGGKVRFTDRGLDNTNPVMARLLEVFEDDSEEEEDE